VLSARYAKWKLGSERPTQSSGISSQRNELLKNAKAYRHPRYYEIAFSFVDPVKQVDLYERFIRRFSSVEVSRVAELGCGPGLILREFARRGYRTIGLDLSRPMLSHLLRASRDEGSVVEPVLGDLNDFRLRPVVDFAMTLMGTIDHIPDRERMKIHLGSVAASLKRGGLYLIENYRLDWTWKSLNGSVSWEMEREGIHVSATFTSRVADTLSQRIRQRLELRVRERGKRTAISEEWDSEVIFPREFEEMVEDSRKFEFIGWFERYSLRKLTRADGDNLALLKRR
jgi:SAM-dependent methyltransferase